MIVLSVLIMWMRDLADVQLRKQHEHKSLNECDEQTKRQQQHQNQDVRQDEIRVRRKQMRERLHHFLVRKDVRKQTNAERERANQVTDQLNRENQWRDPPDRSGQVLQVTEHAVLFNTDVVVIKKRRQSEGKRDAGRRCRTHEQREKSHQVRDQNQQRKSHHDRKVLQAVRADDVLKHAANGEHA